MKNGYLIYQEETEFHFLNFNTVTGRTYRIELTRTAFEMIDTVVKRTAFDQGLTQQLYADLYDYWIDRMFQVHHGRDKKEDIPILDLPKRVRDAIVGIEHIPNLPAGYYDAGA